MKIFKLLGAAAAGTWENFPLVQSQTPNSSQIFPPQLTWCPIRIDQTQPPIPHEVNWAPSKVGTAQERLSLDFPLSQSGQFCPTDPILLPLSRESQQQTMNLADCRRSQLICCRMMICSGPSGAPHQSWENVVSQRRIISETKWHTYLCSSKVCSEPWPVSLPQWRWNWFRVYEPFRGPPEMLAP